MVITIDDLHAEALEGLMVSQDMSAQHTVQAAIRLYQHEKLMLAMGCRKVWLDKDGKDVKKRLVGCSALD